MSLEQARKVKRENSSFLHSLPNVCGVGIGFEEGQDGHTAAVIKVYLTKKVPASLLLPKELVPGELDGVPVRVELSDTPRASES